MPMKSFSIICKDISNQDIFIFADQMLVFQDDNQQIINITQSIANNQILSAFLQNSTIFVSTQFDEQKIGQYPSPQPFQEVFIQSKQIKGIEVSQIEMSYNRLSQAEIQKIQQSPINQQSKINSIKFSKELWEIKEENYKQSLNSMNNQKFNSSLLNKTCKNNFLSVFEEEEEEEELTLNFKKISTLSNQSNFLMQAEIIKNPQQNNETINKNNINFQQTFDELNDLQKYETSSFISDSINLPRSKERTILSAVIIVSKWRDLYQQSKQKKMFYDLQYIAEEMGLSKKVLDYYFLELRTAEFFNFDFSSNLNEKFGKLRKFNNTNKAQYIENKNCKKIPISNQLNYRLPPPYI